MFYELVGHALLVNKQEMDYYYIFYECQIINLWFKILNARNIISLISRKSWNILALVFQIFIDKNHEDFSSFFFPFNVLTICCEDAKDVNRKFKNERQDNEKNKEDKQTNRQTMVYKSLHRNKYQETHKTGYIFRCVSIMKLYIISLISRKSWNILALVFQIFIDKNHEDFSIFFFPFNVLTICFLC
jgi:cytochrome c oxidase subunit IV